MCPCNQETHGHGGVEMGHEVLPNKYTPIVTPTKVANAIKGMLRAPFSLASFSVRKYILKVILHAYHTPVSVLGFL
jgi:hypothetical protein